MYEDIVGAALAEDLGGSVSRDLLGPLVPVRNAPVFIHKIYAVVEVVEKRFVKCIVILHENNRQTESSAILSFLFFHGFKGVQYPFDLFPDIQFLPVKMFKILSFTPHLCKFLFELVDAALEILVVNHELPHPFLDLCKLFLEVLQQSLPLCSTLKSYMLNQAPVTALTGS